MLHPQTDMADGGFADAPTARQSARYLATLLGGFALFVAVFMVWGLRGRDHFAQIPLNGDTRWYQNYAHFATREMGDRDVLFHGVGRSIQNLRKADIVILGHSVLEFAIISDMIDAFQAKHGVRIFNLTTPGIASGEFVRQLLKKNKIGPKIWIINADDYPADFFSPKMDDFFATGRNSAFQIVETGKLKGYLQAASRNIRWRIEHLIVRFGPAWIKQPPYPFNPSAPTTWRNVETGNFSVDQANGYLSAAPVVKTVRQQACPATDQEIGWARNFLGSLGGTPVLTLVPYDGWCAQRLSDLADALDVESFMPPDANFEVFDGRHMTKNGGIAYTRFMLGALEQTNAFKALKGQPTSGPRSRSGSRPDPATPVSLCVANTAATQLFVSLRYRDEAVDQIVSPGETLRRDGRAGGRICSDTNPFNRDQCPNSRLQSTAACP